MRRLLTSALLALCLAVSAEADESGATLGELPAAGGSAPGDATAAATATAPSTYDRLWDAARLYHDEANPVLQEFALQGRLHLQWATGSSDQGDYGSGDRPEDVTWGGLEVRRWRVGFKSRWFHHFKLDGTIDIHPDWDPFYSQLFDLHLTWAPSDQFHLAIGKFRTNFFSVDQATTSKEILTFERSLLSDTLIPGQLTGMRMNGEINHFIYTAAVYAGDDQREFTAFDAGVVYQAGLGYNLKDMTGWDRAIVKLDYQYSDDAANAGGGASFEHAFSLNSTWQKGRFLMYTDLLGGTGRGSQGDVVGFHLNPSYFVADKLQLVLRYQFAHGDDDGLRLSSRYERLAPDVTDGGRGEDYQAVCLGLNYYLYGHKLKLMAGTEYHRMDGGSDGGDFDGWTTLVGLRMYF